LDPVANCKKAKNRKKGEPMRMCPRIFRAHRPLDEKKHRAYFSVKAHSVSAMALFDLKKNQKKNTKGSKNSKNFKKRQKKTSKAQIIV
jgi:hypothetical protein